jgi:gliding motility-associated-like protein
MSPSLCAFAQGEGDNWVFPKDCWMEYNDQTQSVFLSSLPSKYPKLNWVRGPSSICPSISDKNGNLLFYIGFENDTTISLFNNSGQVVQNGHDLPFQYYTGNFAIFLPDLTRKKIYLYYIDTVNGFVRFEIDYHDYDNSFILSSPSLISSSHKGRVINAIKNSDNVGWWIILGGYPTNKLYVYYVNNLACQFVGNIQIPTNEIGEYSEENLTISTSGNLISHSAGSVGTFLFDFNRCSGNIQFKKNIPILNGDEYANIIEAGVFASFSQNENYLFVTNTTSLFRYDLTSSDIMNSRIKIIDITNFTNPKGYAAHWGCSMFSDNRIYISYYVARNVPFFLKDTINSYLGVIENPDCDNFCFDFVRKGFSLDTLYASNSLPVLPNFRMKPLWENTQRDFVPDTVFSCSDLALQLIPSVQSGFTFEWYGMDGGLLHKGDTLMLERPTEKAYIVKVYERVSDCSYALFDTVHVKFAPSCEDVTVEVPNVFSPNSDGINDSWRIYAKGDLLEENLKIYNRFGRIMYAGSAIYGWNGANAGEGVYAYHLTYRDNRGRHQRTGMFTLLK